MDALRGGLCFFRVSASQHDVPIRLGSDIFCRSETYTRIRTGNDHGFHMPHPIRAVLLRIAPAFRRGPNCAGRMAGKSSMMLLGVGDSMLGFLLPFRFLVKATLP